MSHVNFCPSKRVSGCGCSTIVTFAFGTSVAVVSFALDARRCLPLDLDESFDAGACTLLPADAADVGTFSLLRLGVGVAFLAPDVRLLRMVVAGVFSLDLADAGAVLRLFFAVDVSATRLDDAKLPCLGDAGISPRQFLATAPCCLSRPPRDLRCRLLLSRSEMQQSRRPGKRSFCRLRQNRGASSSDSASRGPCTAFGSIRRNRLQGPATEPSFHPQHPRLRRGLLPSHAEAATAAPSATGMFSATDGRTVARSAGAASMRDAAAICSLRSRLPLPRGTLHVRGRERASRPRALCRAPRVLLTAAQGSLRRRGFGGPRRRAGARPPRLSARGAQRGRGAPPRDAPPRFAPFRDAPPRTRAAGRILTSCGPDGRMISGHSDSCVKNETPGARRPKLGHRRPARRVGLEDFDHRMKMTRQILNDHP